MAECRTPTTSLLHGPSSSLAPDRHSSSSPSKHTSSPRSSSSMTSSILKPLPISPRALSTLPPPPTPPRSPPPPYPEVVLICLGHKVGLHHSSKLTEYEYFKNLFEAKEMMTARGGSRVFQTNVPLDHHTVSTIIKIINGDRKKLPTSKNKLTRLRLAAFHFQLKDLYDKFVERYIHICRNPFRFTNLWDEIMTFDNREKFVEMLVRYLVVHLLQVRTSVEFLNLSFERFLEILKVASENHAPPEILLEVAVTWIRLQSTPPPQPSSLRAAESPPKEINLKGKQSKTLKARCAKLVKQSVKLSIKQSRKLPPKQPTAAACKLYEEIKQIQQYIRFPSETRTFVSEICRSFISLGIAFKVLDEVKPNSDPDPDYTTRGRLFVFVKKDKVVYLQYFHLHSCKWSIKMVLPFSLTGWPTTNNSIAFADGKFYFVNKNSRILEWVVWTTEIDSLEPKKNALAVGIAAFQGNLYISVVQPGDDKTDCECDDLEDGVYRSVVYGDSDGDTEDNAAVGPVSPHKDRSKCYHCRRGYLKDPDVIPKYKHKLCLCEVYECENLFCPSHWLDCKCCQLVLVDDSEAVTHAFAIHDGKPECGKSFEIRMFIDETDEWTSVGPPEGLDQYFDLSNRYKYYACGGGGNLFVFFINEDPIFSYVFSYDCEKRTWKFRNCQKPIIKVWPVVTCEPGKICFIMLTPDYQLFKYCPQFSNAADEKWIPITNGGFPGHLRTSIATSVVMPLCSFK